MLAVAAALALAGCSTLKLAYGNASRLAWWWVDSYFGFERADRPAVRGAIDDWIDWHRRTQLAGVVALLDEAAGEVRNDTSAAAVCEWQQRLAESFQPSLQHAAEVFAGFVPVLGAAQLAQLEKRFAKNERELRRDLAQTDPAERAEAAADRYVDGTETVYGSVNAAQRKLIAEGVAGSPFDAEAWLAERARFHRDTLQTLRRLAAEHAGADRALPELRALIDRLHAASAASTRQRDHGCALGARIHNAATPQQREAARERLAGWAGDLRSFVPGATAATD